MGLLTILHLVKYLMSIKFISSYSLEYALEYGFTYTFGLTFNFTYYYVSLLFKKLKNLGKKEEDVKYLVEISSNKKEDIENVLKELPEEDYFFLEENYLIILTNKSNEKLDKLIKDKIEN
jgi:hypothetical protein